MQAIVLHANPIRWVACKALGMLSSRFYWSRLSNLRMQHVPDIALPGADWVRLRTVLGGICGTDIAAIAQRNHPATILRAFTSFPIILGHENVAIIDTVGTAVKGWERGCRVIVEPALSCAVRGIEEPCRCCKSGLFSLCGSVLGDQRFPPGTMIGLNSFTGGSWAPSFVAHQAQLHAVPHNMTDAEAVVIDPMACAVHAILRRIPADDELVIIQGGGMIGLAVVMALRSLDSRCRVLACVHSEKQGEKLRLAGADESLITAGKNRGPALERIARLVGGTRVKAPLGNDTIVGGADVVYDCVGTGRSLTDAMKLCRARGTVVAVGTSQISLLDTTPMWFNELSVIGAYGRQIECFRGNSMHTYDVVIQLWKEGRLKLDGLLSHKFRIEHYKQALSLLVGPKRGAVTKAAFEFP